MYYKLTLNGCRRIIIRLQEQDYHAWHQAPQIVTPHAPSDLLNSFDTEPEQEDEDPLITFDTNPEQEDNPIFSFGSHEDDHIEDLGDDDGDNSPMNLFSDVCSLDFLFFCRWCSYFLE